MIFFIKLFNQKLSFLRVELTEAYLALDFTITMKSYLLMICIGPILTFAQNANKLFYGNGDTFIAIGSTNDSTYMEPTSFYGQSVRWAIKSKSKGSVQEEFIRYNDSSFIYLQYDSSGYKTMEGLLALNRNRVLYDTILVPDLAKDPDLSKGIMMQEYLANYPFEKTGYWTEQKGDSVSQGVYGNGKRQGIWKHGRYRFVQTFGFVNRDIFVPESLSNYTDTSVIENFIQDISSPAMQRLLSQNWRLNDRNSSYSSRHYIRTDDADARIWDQGNAPFRYLVNGIVELKGSNHRFKVVYISDTELYLQPLNEK